MRVDGATVNFINSISALKKMILLILILIALYFIFRGEMFANSFAYVRLFSGGSQWANYCSSDGKKLSYTFRKKIDRVESHLRAGDSFALYGSALCDYGTTGIANKFIGPGPNWEKICDENSGPIVFPQLSYNCYHIEIKFC